MLIQITKRFTQFNRAKSQIAYVRWFFSFYYFVNLKIVQFDLNQFLCIFFFWRIFGQLIAKQRFIIDMVLTDHFFQLNTFQYFISYQVDGFWKAQVKLHFSLVFDCDITNRKNHSLNGKKYK